MNSSRNQKAISRPYSVLEDKLENLKNQIDKIFTSQNNYATKIDLQHIIKQIKRPSSSHKPTVKYFEEQTIKLQEFESRLNSLWRSNKELVDLFDGVQFKQNNLSDIPYTTREENDEKIGKVENKLNEIQEAFKDKLIHIKSDLDKIYQDINPSEIEAYFRSNVLSLRGEINRIKASVQILEDKTAITNGFFDKANEQNIDMDESSENQIKTLLKQHETAIRAIASKISLSTNLTDHEPRKAEQASYLIHLEDLRIEMKEMITKLETSKSLSAKDIELLHEINITLNTKISRDEFETKVDKPELRKTYVLLKKKIDEISSYLKKAEANPTMTREDAFFLKKRLDVECAACGQGIPESSDLAGMQYQPWNKLPTRYHVPGFSRLLNSLVVSSSGEFTLPPRKEVNTVDIISPISKCATPSVRKPTTKKTIRAKLPQLNNV